MSNNIYNTTGVKPTDATLVVDQKDTLYVPLATEDRYGVVKVGENLEVDNGVLSVNSEIPEEIDTLQDEVVWIKQNMYTAKTYIGTYPSATTKPTRAELTTFVEEHTPDTRTPRVQNGDLVLFTQIIEFGTDISYEYIYSQSGWLEQPIPSVEAASNGNFGILEGTYGIDSSNNTLVNIVGGQILNIYVRKTDNTFADIRTLINTNIASIEDIIDGDTIVGEAIKATQDSLGNDIVATYMTKTIGATKQFVYDYALPKEFGNISYISASGLVDDVPTTPASGIQFTETTTGAGTFPAFTVTKSSGGEYELSKSNGCTNNIWVDSNADTIVRFQLITKIKHQADADYTILCSQMSNVVDLTANTKFNLQFNSLFTALNRTVFETQLTDTIAQTLNIITEDTSPVTFKVYSNSVTPSAFSLNIQTSTIDVNTIGAPKEVFVHAEDFTESGGLYTKTVTRLEHGQPLSDNYIIQAYYYEDGTYNSLLLDYSIDSNGDITVKATEPLDIKLLIAAKMETRALGVSRLTNPDVLENIEYATVGAIDITQTIPAVDLTLPDPVITNVNYKVFVFNNASSTNNIRVNGVELTPNTGVSFAWNGSWVRTYDLDVETDEVWDVAKNQLLSVTLTDLVTQEQLLDNIGNIIHLDCDATLDTVAGKITLNPVETLVNFELEHNKEYYVSAVLGITTLTGELQDSYTVVYEENSDTVNITSIINPDEAHTITVGQLCPLMEAYNEVQGYVFGFRAIAKIIDGVKYLYITNLQRELNPPMTGERLYNAIINNTLKPFTTVNCMSDYTNGTTTYTTGHNYLITGSWSDGVLITGTQDITVGKALDNITITANAEDKAQAVGLTDGTNTITGTQVYNGLSRVFL